jgi:Flp pilus assembly pilin Flp
MILGFYAKVQTLWSGLRGRLVGETGAVATEYALLLLLIALAIIAAATGLGLALADKFKSACTTLGGASC